MLVFVAILMGLTALAAGLAAPTRHGAPTTTEPLVIAAPSRPAPPEVERTIGVTAPQTVAVGEGALLRLTVVGDLLDTVEIPGLGQLAAIAPDTPAVFDVFADQRGSYPVRLVSTGRQIGLVRVTPGAQE
jgi:hypothetical protein